MPDDDPNANRDPEERSAFDDPRWWNADSLTRELEALAPELRRLLAEALAGDGSLELTLGLTSAEARARVRAGLLDLGWVTVGPEPAAVLTIARPAREWLASALIGSPRLERHARPRLATEPDRDAAEVTLARYRARPEAEREALREVARRGGWCSSAALDERSRRVLIEARPDLDFALARLEQALPAERGRGPVALLSPHLLLLLGDPPRSATRIRGAPGPLLATATLSGLLDRGRLRPRKRGGWRKRDLAELARLCPAGPGPWCPAEPAAALLEIAIEAGLLTLAEGEIQRGPALDSHQLAPPTRRAERLRAAAARRALSELDSGREAVLEMTESSFDWLDITPRALGVDELDRVLLLARLGEVLRSGSRLDEAAELDDLAAGLWRAGTPWLAWLGLVDLGMDHLGAPVSLRPSEFLRAGLSGDEGEAAVELLTADGRSDRVALGIPSARARLLWRCAEEGELEQQAERLVWRPTRARLEVLRGRLEALAPGAFDALPRAPERSEITTVRARRWLILDVPSVALADRLAELDELKPGVVDRITPTVLLLRGPEVLDDALRDRLAELGVAIEGP